MATRHGGNTAYPEVKKIKLFIGQAKTPAPPPPRYLMVAPLHHMSAWKYSPPTLSVQSKNGERSTVMAEVCHPAGQLIVSADQPSDKKAICLLSCNTHFSRSLLDKNTSWDWKEIIS